MDTFGLHTKVVQALNGTPTAALEAAASTVLATLTGRSSAAQSASAQGDELTSAGFDGLCMVLAIAVQHRLAPSAFQEQLSSGSLRSDVVRTIVQSYTLSFDEASAAQRSNTAAAKAVLEDGFLPRITGVSWNLGHALGDRMLDPPSRSLPAFDFSIATYDQLHDTEDTLRIALPAERLSDFHNTVREMLREAEQVARGN
jgi:hypothetical protein